ncbi:MAG: hypothetical protein EA379_04405 [Phycisphaerales bacterium]|nr:MAG: hypothetical protein EA379_04405 [Phycisphaerales bacterium]
MMHLTATAAILAFSAGAASAGVIGFSQLGSAIDGDQGVAFTGTAGYTHTGGNAGSLVITLTNTTPSVGGTITGLAFNSGVDGVSATLTSSTHAAFQGMTNVNTMPFGHSFLAGAALGGNWQGGGNPAGGIGVGDTGIFVFSVLSAQAESLQASNFFDGPAEQNFVIRFRGLDNGGSAKAPAMITPDIGGTIPAPGAAAPLAALLLLGSRRRR